MPVIQTGSAISNIDLLQKLVTWLVSRSWTSNMSQVDGSGWRAHLSKAGIYINLRATVLNEGAWVTNFSNSGNYCYALHLYLGSGFNSGAAFRDQPGGPTQSGTSSTVGVAAVTGSGAITSYQFIDDGFDNITIIIECTPGVYRHLAWGSLIKYGSWTGGAYFSGSTPGYYANTSSDGGLYKADPPFISSSFTGGAQGHACFVRADVDAFTGKWLCGGLTATAAAGYTGKYASSGLAGAQSPPTDMPRMGVYAFRNLHGTLDGRAITLPIVLYGARDAGGYSALGEIPSMRFCPISEVGGASIGSDLALGAETWRVFPSCLVRVA
jgi:hypothetical protein